MQQDMITSQSVDLYSILVTIATIRASKILYLFFWCMQVSVLGVLQAGVQAITGSGVSAS